MNLPNWMPDEGAFAGSEHIDPEYVAGYDRKSATNAEEDLASLTQLGLDASATLVDLGAGTGSFTLAAAQVCRRVVAVDVSSQMLGVLLRKLDNSGVTNVEAVRAGFLTYGHRSEPADFVYTRHALHHLPDFFKVVALQRISRILRPGGVLCLRDLTYSFDPGVAGTEIERWVAGGTDDPASGWTRDELETHVRLAPGTDARAGRLRDSRGAAPGFDLLTLHVHKKMTMTAVCPDIGCNGKGTTPYI